MIIIKYARNPTIKQSQLDDFLGKPTKTLYDMRVQKEYKAARKMFRKWLPVQLRRAPDPGVPRAVWGRQTSLFEHVDQKLLPILPKPAYAWRFRGIIARVYEDFAINVISEREWFITHALSAFNGYFNHLFEFVDFSYFDDLQEKLETHGVSFKRIFMHDVIAYELLRAQLGFKDYTGIEKMALFIGNIPLKGILHDDSFLPSASDTSRVMRCIPPAGLLNFMYMLVTQLINLKVIVPRILVWDCQFVHSNCNDNPNPKTKRYNDYDAGYGRHNGKKLGVGFKISRLYAYCGSWSRAFEVYFEVFPANKSDNPIFRETLVHFMNLKLGTWDIILGDTGAYSEQSLELCLYYGMHPIIRAKTGLVNQPVIDVKKGYWFNTAYFPSGWTADDVVAMYACRPVIEACQSWNDTIYNASRMNTRGKGNVIRHQAILNILTLTRAITACKIGRIDLIPVVTAFSTAREFMIPSGWQPVGRKSGFDTLLPPPRFNLAHKKNDNDG